jgi:hypothetical protein
MSLVSTLRYVMPYGLVQHIFRSKAARRRRMDVHNAAYASVIKQQAKYSYSAAIAFHRARGITGGHLTGGSMPEATLDFCLRSLDNLLSERDRPLIGLHVGNFLGISLSHFTNYVRGRHEKSVIFSIDPNIQHEGIESPQDHVIAILNNFDLQKNAIVSVGYSTNKTISNDGITFVGQNGAEYDPYSNFNAEQSCEDTLANLALLSSGRFDFAVVDGNHEGSHLKREVALLAPLLRHDGLLILDDVSDSWIEIKEEYGSLLASGWKAVGADGRVGILQRS